MVKVIFNSGNLYVRIPKEVAKLSGLAKGSELQVHYDKTTQQIIIEKI